MFCPKVLCVKSKILSVLAVILLQLTTLPFRGTCESTCLVRQRSASNQLFRQSSAVMAMELEALPPLAFFQENAVKKSDELDKKRRGVMPGKGEDASGSAGPGEAEQADLDFVSAVA